MTREEAIKELEEDKALYMPKEWIENIDRDTPDGRLITALDMAIEALKLIPDNATNGDVIKALFPDADISLNDSCFEGVVNRYGFDEKWWNTPYEAESASEKEKLKAEVNGYFYGLNAAGKIDWSTYNTLYNVCMSILEKYYDRMEKERRAESEKETNRLQVGDKIEVQFGNETHFATAIQQKNDVMLFLTDDYLDDAMPMNPTDTTKGGWEGSALREKLQDIAKNTDIKDCLTPFENGDLLTLLSIQEMFGRDENYNKCDGQIEWLKDRWHRIAGRKWDAYERGWLRSVVSASTLAFVSDAGILGGSACASAALGVRPAFTIRIRNQDMIFLPHMNIWRPQNRK